MAQNKKAAARASAAKKIFRTQSSGNDAAAQRARVLDFLRQHGSLSTLDARYLIDVLHPAARVMELRRFGHEIATVWSHETTPEGGEHRVARYHLMHEVAA
ncbi:helix-turn-helix domain-containing protein [Burkholderia sp. AU30280]|uniref:helix-turn-helix domain-containing protein n=1 Tax=Burkholderia sp. AU30280 TaxID=2879628 RepID=UPI001CF177E6|nr:helix-turn-helix domain-containing protein [Burkholderia sp. AU30280]MCA8275247.1 helix-turn-helix domain-containing protein [Burkholderia sp. AU30280]